jgi:hypothetical protein
MQKNDVYTTLGQRFKKGRVVVKSKCSVNTMTDYFSPILMSCIIPDDTNEKMAIKTEIFCLLELTLTAVEYY